MRTIKQFVQEGIATPDDLKDALKLAMQLEFSTILPYLCAEWSIDSSGNPSDVAGIIHGIVVEEMFHFALAGNMLSAIGGVPGIASPYFIISYPTHVLPGGIAQELPVDLQPLSLDQVKVFMQIELPEFPPIALTRETPPATIGAFYATIADAFTAIKPAIDPTAHFVNMGGAVQIKSIPDALAAIARIKDEGEGSPGSPSQPPADGTQPAHYYLFKEILVGKKLVQTQGKWGFTGDKVTFPKVLPFKQSEAKPNPSTAFNQALTLLLKGLQECWVTGQGPDIGAMFQLQTLGQDLITQGIRPQFLWAGD